MPSQYGTYTSSAHFTSFATHAPLLLLWKVERTVFFTSNLPQWKLQAEYSRCPRRTQEGMRFASLMKVLREVSDNPFLLHLPIPIWIAKVADHESAGYPALLPLSLRGQASPKERQHWLRLKRNRGASPHINPDCSESAYFLRGDIIAESERGLWRCLSCRR